jgi:hypothetical protein
VLRPPGSYQKDDNGALTSVGSMWSVLKYDFAGAIIFQPALQASPNYFCTNILQLILEKPDVNMCTGWKRVRIGIKNGLL